MKFTYDTLQPDYAVQKAWSMVGRGRPMVVVAASNSVPTPQSQNQLWGQYPQISEEIFPKAVEGD